MKRSAPSDTSPVTIRLLLHCEDGIVPYMTPNMLKKYVPPLDDLWLGIAVRDTCVVAQFKPPSDKNNSKKKKESDKTKPSGFSFQFKGLDSFLLPYNRVTVPSFDLLVDAAKYDSRSEPTGVSSSNTFVQVWTPHGRHKLSPDLYAECARGLQSQAVVPLYDMALPTESNKRKQNATIRNATWLSKYVNDNRVGNVWAPVVLGLDINDEKSALEERQHEQSKQSNGIAFVGQQQGTDPASQLKPFLEKLDKIPPTVALLSIHSTSEFIEAARAGVNMLGTALPTFWSRSKRAFVVPFSIDSSKRLKVSDNDGESSLDPGCDAFDTDGCIDLHDTKWASDSLPLTPGCTCMACGNSHSRAYIHHLVQAKELLAEILLFSHNLHHLREMCRSMSTDMDGTCCLVTSQLSRKTTT